MEPEEYLKPQSPYTGLTITVVQSNGERLKTLARNVMLAL
jgi:hypothetical protein